MPNTLIFIHGWGNTSQVFDALVNILMPSLSGTYAIERWSLPGHGEGENPIENLNLTDAQVQLDALLDAWAERLPHQCILVGWSLGGMLATALALRAPAKVRALICLAASPSFIERESWSHGMAVDAYEKFYQNFCEHPVNTWHRFQRLQAMGAGNGKALKASLRNLPEPDAVQLQWWRSGLRWLSCLDHRSLISTVRCPGLHLFGDEDRVLDHAQANDIQSLLISDLAEPCQQEVLSLSGAGHLFPHTHAGVVAKHLQLFLTTKILDSAIPKKHISASFSRAALSYDNAADIQYRCAQTLLNMVPKNDQSCIVDLGAGTGFLARLISQQNSIRYARFVSLDISSNMLCVARDQLSADGSHYLVQGDMASLPFSAGSQSLVLSNFAMQWCSDLDTVFRQVHSIMAPQGEFIFTLLGSDTLRELKQAWTQVDQFVHVNAFADIEQVRRQLPNLGFDIIHYRSDAMIEYFETLSDLLKSLKVVGARNMNQGRPPGLTAPSRFRVLETAYESMRNASGALPLTYDVHFFRVKLK